MSLEVFGLTIKMKMLVSGWLTTIIAEETNCERNLHYRTNNHRRLWFKALSTISELFIYECFLFFYGFSLNKFAFVAKTRRWRRFFKRWTVRVFVFCLPFCYSLLISSLPVQQLYPFGQRDDQLLPVGDEVSSPEIHLSIPIVFYENEYNSIFVSAQNLCNLFWRICKYFAICAFLPHWSKLRFILNWRWPSSS